MEESSIRDYKQRCGQEVKRSHERLSNTVAPKVTPEPNRARGSSYQTQRRPVYIDRDYLTDIGHFGPIVTGLKGSICLITSKPNKT